jgi:hypothetical protein
MGRGKLGGKIGSGTAWGATALLICSPSRVLAQPTNKRGKEKNASINLFIEKSKA